MYIFILFYINYIYCQNITNFTDIAYINEDNKYIDNAVYVIRNRNGDINLEITNQNYGSFLDYRRKGPKRNFVIQKENNNSNINETYYYIIDNISKKKLTASIGKNNEDKVIFSTEMNMNNELSLWKIIPKINSNNQLVYYVQNKNNKRFWQNSINYIILSKTSDINSLLEDNEFQFVRMYRESDKYESEILKNEPIDVLIKYIDLSDKNLVRKGIPQTKKDIDNKELKYSVRSILQNIPWIRKIFILMPNEKVSYFKPAEEIKQKIIYVKDKDLLGFDSASSPVFQFNLYKMKKFNISENFILMDDDYFIAKPLNKNDFFYEENGKVYPALVTSDYYEMDKNNLNKELSGLFSKRDSNNPHSTSGFLIQHDRSLLLMYDIFGEDDRRYGKKLIEPAFSHNAIPVKLSDIKEIHDYIIKYYPYANETLNSLFRTTKTLQMQTLYMAYVKNQYDRKVSMISSAFYDLIGSRRVPKNNQKLFVINTGKRNYNPILYYKGKF